MGRKELLGSETLLSPEGDNCTTVKCEEILGAQPSNFGKWCAQLLLQGWGRGGWVGFNWTLFILGFRHAQTCSEDLDKTAENIWYIFFPLSFAWETRTLGGDSHYLALLQYIRVKGRKGSILNTEELFSLRLSHETKVLRTQTRVLWRRALGLRCLLTHVGGTGQSRASQFSQCG